MVLEIDKSYVNRFYNGDVNEAVKNMDGNLWTDEKIKGAFNFGNGTKKHLKKYIENNKNYAYFIEV